MFEINDKIFYLKNNTEAQITTIFIGCFYVFKFQVPISKKKEFIC